MDRRLLRELERLLGERGVVHQAARRRTYESDGLALLAAEPDVVLLPRNTAECAAAMRLLAAHGVAIVPRGAGTGLSGGATPVAGSALVGTARMRDVLEVCPEDRFARVQAGLVNVDLTRACAGHGLFYAPDPSSQAACTIGGNVAENSGGPHCFKYGATTRHVLGLVVVLPDGEVLDLSGPELDPPDLDLVGFFLGSEGTLGVATEVTVNLVPKPPVVETLLSIHASLDEACACVTELIAERLEPSALEILDRATIQAVEASVFRAGYPQDAEAVLLIEVEGTEVEVAGTVADVTAICRRHGALELRAARDAGERARLWAGRKGAFGAMGRIAPDLYVADVVVPRTRLAEVVRASTEICAARSLKVANVFHAGDGNLHPNISYDRRDPAELARVLDAGDEIMRLCIAAGGSLTGEHGVGLEKQAMMSAYFTPADLAVQDRARTAWDPERRMNPGKVLPMRACMEVRTRAAVPPGSRLPSGALGERRGGAPHEPPPRQGGAA